MQIAMTERDKKLIVILSIIVIVVAIGYWFIRPALKDVKEMKEEIEEQESLKRLNDIKMAQMPVMQVDIEDNKAEIETLKDEFYPMMNSDEIDKYFTSMVLNRNLFAYDLNIEIENTPSSLEPYQYATSISQFADEEYEDEEYEDDESEDSEDEDSYDAYDAYDDELYMDSFDDEEEDSEPANTNVYAANVTMRSGGSEENMMKLIDDLSIMDHRMLVRGYSWTITKNTVVGEDTPIEGNDITNTYSEMDASGIFTVVDRMELNLNLTMYMYQE